MTYRVIYIDNCLYLKLNGCLLQLNFYINTKIHVKLVSICLVLLYLLRVYGTLMIHIEKLLNIQYSLESKVK